MAHQEHNVEGVRKRGIMVPHVTSQDSECLTPFLNEAENNHSSDDEEDYELNVKNCNGHNGESIEINKEGWQPLQNPSVIETQETVLSIALQVFFPFLIAGFGTVGAGLVLDVVQHWDVFKDISEIFILVPALLGLKGNLEMTLASRLSTQANMGKMDTYNEQWVLATGNMALIQCQAVVVGFLASIFAIIMGWIPEGEFNIAHALIMCASSIVTASIASFVLGCVMVGVVIFSRKCRINPDNVATPIAASLGDLTTLSLLSGISYFLYSEYGSLWLSGSLITVFIALLPLWVYIAKHNKYTNEVLYSGWSAVIGAMAISSVGGCILDFAIDKFYGLAVFQPVINGVGGNLVAVQASRISTHLHQTCTLGTLPEEDNNLCINPASAFFGKSVHAMTARVLMMMVVPGHLAFTYGIRFMNGGHTSVTPMFLTVYLLAAVLQVSLLLYIAHGMVYRMWANNVDPDNSAIPYLTAIGDMLGTALLLAAFYILYQMGDKDSDVGE